MIKPMTIGEVKDLPCESTIYIEDRGGRTNKFIKTTPSWHERSISSGLGGMLYVYRKFKEKGFTSYREFRFRSYGYSWRCWERRPTILERLLSVWRCSRGSN